MLGKIAAAGKRELPVPQCGVWALEDGKSREKNKKRISGSGVG